MSCCVAGPGSLVAFTAVGGDYKASGSPRAAVRPPSVWPRAPANRVKNLSGHKQGNQHMQGLHAGRAQNPSLYVQCNQRDVGQPFPDSIVASIRRCHRRDRGSIPRQEGFFRLCSSAAAPRPSVLPRQEGFLLKPRSASGLRCTPLRAPLRPSRRSMTPLRSKTLLLHSSLNAIA